MQTDIVLTKLDTARTACLFALHRIEAGVFYAEET